MKIIPCPLNGPRNVSEFMCAGPVKIPSDSVSAGEETWADYLFMEDNRSGAVLEWWCHLASSYWFILERDTGTDEVIAAWRPEERPDLL